MGDNLKEVNWGSDFVIKQIAPCGGHTCGLSTNKRVKCFGDAQYGLSFNFVLELIVFVAVSFDVYRKPRIWRYHYFGRRGR